MQRLFPLLQLLDQFLNPQTNPVEKLDGVSWYCQPASFFPISACDAYDDGHARGANERW
jgi:hypothetical protein